MRQKLLFGAVVCGLCSAMLATPAGADQDRVSATEKGSLLYFSKVELQWDYMGNLIQDTFVDISNDYPDAVQVQMYFINGDLPLEEVWTEDDPPVFVERAHFGCNWVNNHIHLTKNEPAYWSVATGLPKGVSPFEVLDPGFPPGRPYDPFDPMSDRYLRGYIIAFAVTAENQEIRWNHLKGDVTVVNYRDCYAWEYNAWAFQLVDPLVLHGMVSTGLGQLDLNGVEYAQAFDQLLLDFYAVGSSALSGPRLVEVDTDLTLHVVDADLRQEADDWITTKAHIDIWNMNEVKFSGTYRCITKWDQTMLSHYGVPNHFLLLYLQTDKGKARIDGVASQYCDPDFYGNNSVDAALLGVAAKILTFDGGLCYAAAGTNLIGMGEESATVKFDLQLAPPEAPVLDPGFVFPNEIIKELKAGQ